MGLTGLDVLGPNMEIIPLSHSMLKVGRNRRSPWRHLTLSVMYAAMICVIMVYPSFLCLR